MRRVFAGVAVIACVSGVGACGGSHAPAPPAAERPDAPADPAAQPPVPPAEEPADCVPAGELRGARLSVCFELNSGAHGTFRLEDGTGTSTLPVAEPEAKGPLAGHWAWAAVSPDGSTLLAQWSAECEVPIAFFVSAEGGAPRMVTGDRDWTTAPQSVALGWTTDGRAIVFLQAGACGTSGEPGVYLVDPDGGMVLARATDAVPADLEPSVEPRAAAAVVG